MTHKQLVDVAHKWVLKNGSCGVVFKELKASTIYNEIPDVIGFGSFVHSVLIECKTSRSDFIADKKKYFRINSDKGVGRQRFYCCPTNLIKIEELPDGWGLIYVNDKFKAICLHNPYKGLPEVRHKGFEPNLDADRNIMYSALRRLQVKGLVKEIYNK